MVRYLSPLLRRSVMALALAQVAMSALAPVHAAGARGDEEQRSTRIERPHQHPGVPAHDPDTCPICQLLTTPLLRPEVTRVVPASVAVVRPYSASVALPAARGPPTAHRTRAPPTDLA